MSNQFENAINAYKSKPINRATITDGKLLQYWCIEPLSARDNVVADVITTLSGDTCHRDDSTNKLYYYINNDTQDDTSSDLDMTDRTLAITDELDVTDKLATTVITSTNITTTGVTTTAATTTSLNVNNDLTINDNFYLKEKASDDSVKAFTAIIKDINDQFDATNNYIKTHEQYWDNLVSVQISEGTADVPPDYVHGNPLNISASENVSYSTVKENNNLKFTVNVNFKSAATVSNHVLDLTTL